MMNVGYSSRIGPRRFFDLLAADRRRLNFEPIGFVTVSGGMKQVGVVFEQGNEIGMIEAQATFELLERTA